MKTVQYKAVCIVCSAGTGEAFAGLEVWLEGCVLRPDGMGCMAGNSNPYHLSSDTTCWLGWRDICICVS